MSAQHTSAAHAGQHDEHHDDLGYHASYRGYLVGFLLSVVVLQALSLSDVIPYAHFQLNYRVFLYGLATAVFFGLFSGVYPAWRMSRLSPVEALKGASR